MKARLGLRKASAQLAIAIARIDEAVYLASFDLDYLKEKASPADKDFHHKLKAAQSALKAAAQD